MNHVQYMTVLVLLRVFSIHLLNGWHYIIIVLYTVFPVPSTPLESAECDSASRRRSTCTVRLTDIPAVYSQTHRHTSCLQSDSQTYQLRSTTHVHVQSLYKKVQTVSEWVVTVLGNKDHGHHVAHCRVCMTFCCTFCINFLIFLCSCQSVCT